MVLRAVICSLILLTQPLAAWSGVMTMPEQADTLELSAGDHCDDMASHDDVSGDECDIGCDDCTFATGIAATLAVQLTGIVMSEPVPFVLLALPPGRLDSPYRPPSLA